MRLLLATLTVVAATASAQDEVPAAVPEVHLSSHLWGDALQSGFPAVGFQGWAEYRPRLSDSVTAQLHLDLGFATYPAFTYDAFARLQWTASPERQLGLFVAPFSGRRVYLGWDPLLRVGASPFRTSPGGVPTAGVEGQLGPVFVGLYLKSSLVLNDLTQQNERRYASFLDLRWRASSRWSFGLGAAWIDRGVVPSLAIQGIRAPAVLAGTAVSADWRVGAPTGRIAILPRDTQAVEFAELLAHPAPSDDRVGYSAHLEAIAAAQTLEDPDLFAKTEAIGFYGLNARGLARLGQLRVQLLATARSFQLIQADVPGLPPFKSPPDGTLDGPELQGIAAVDYRFDLPGLALYPGVSFQLDRPAFFRTPSGLGGSNPLPGQFGSQVVIVRGANQFNVLPSGNEARLGYDLQATVRAQAERWLIVQAALGYRYDPNWTVLRDDTSGIAQPAYEHLHGLTLDLWAQLAF